MMPFHPLAAFPHSRPSCRRPAAVILLLAALALLSTSTDGMRCAAGQRDAASTDAPTTSSASNDSHATDSSPDDSAASSSADWLTWHNGDHLVGHLERVEDGLLYWSSSAFAAPLPVRLDAVASIRFHGGAEPSNASATTRLVLGNGDFLDGTITRITPDTITIDTARHGPVTVDRKHVVRLTRGRSSVVVLDEIGQLAEWQVQSNRHPLSEWKEHPDGSLSARRRGATIFRPVKFPSRSMTEIVLQWPEHAAFSISWFGVDQNSPNVLKRLAAGFGIRPARSTRTVEKPPPLHVTVWDDELVVESTDDFASIRPIDHGTKKLRLRVFWDRPANKMWFLADGMKKPVEFNLPDPIDPKWKLGIRIQNRGSGLTVKELQVVKWLGETAMAEGGHGPSVELKNGKRVAGTVASLDRPNAQLQLNGGKSFPWNEVVRVEFRTASSGTGPSDAPHQLAFVDGARLSGRIARASADAIWLETDFTKDPIRTPINDQLRLVRLRRSPSYQLPDAPFLARGPDLHLHVDVAAQRDGRMGIQPIGSPYGVAPAVDHDMEIRRKDQSATDGLLHVKCDGNSDMIYLDNQDAVRGKLVRWDKQVVIRTADGTERTLEPEHLVAVSFGGAEDDRSGFSQPGWEIKSSIPRAVRKAEGRIEFYGGGSYRHPNILASNEFRLSMRRTQQSCAFEVRAYAEPGNWSSSGGGVIFGMYGNQIYARSLDGQQGFSTQLDVRKTKRLTWTFRREKDAIVVRIQGKTFFRTSARKMTGRGLSLSLRQHTRGLAPRPAVILSGLEVVPPADLFAAVLPRDKQVALRIPRRQRRHLPTHLFLAQNGDLLRGSLVAIDETSLRISVRDKTRRARRSRIAGIIRLAPPQDSDTDESAKRTTAADNAPQTPYRISTSQTRISGEIESIEQGQVVIVSPLLGRLRIPLDEVTLIEAGKKRRTVGDAAFDDWRCSIVKALPEE